MVTEAGLIVIEHRSIETRDELSAGDRRRRLASAARTAGGWSFARYWGGSWLEVPSIDTWHEVNMVRHSAEMSFCSP